MDVVLKGIGLGLFLAISVGPIVFAIIKTSIQYGHKAGYLFVAGVSLSDLTLVILANLAAELLRNLLAHETVIAISGAIILLCIGFYTLFFKKDPSPSQGRTDIRLPAERQQAFQVLQLSARDMARIFFQGYLLNIINPGPILLWLTWSTSFAYLPLIDRIVLFGTTLLVVLLTDILKVLLAGKMRQKFTPRTLHRINQLTAFIFIGFGLAIIGGLLISRYG